MVTILPPDFRNGVERRRFIELGTGVAGFLVLTAHGSPINSWRVVIDDNNDGEIDAADRILNPLNNKYYAVRHLGDTVQYGATYIRWANMAWCR